MVLPGIESLLGFFVRPSPDDRAVDGSVVAANLVDLT
jgi:hypothetical protein